MGIQRFTQLSANAGAFKNSLTTGVDNKAGLKRPFGISSRNPWRNRIKIVFSTIQLSQAVAHHDIVPSRHTILES